MTMHIFPGGWNCDTSTATMIHQITLFQTPHKKYFLCTQRLGSSEEEIKPLTKKEALEWSAKH
jgi:hypothetical protein